MKEEKSDVAPSAKYANNPTYWPDEPPIGIWFNYGLVDKFMREWMNKKLN